MEIIYFAMAKDNKEDEARLRHLENVLGGLVEIKPAIISREVILDRIDELQYLAGEDARTGKLVYKDSCVGIAAGLYIKELKGLPGALMEYSLKAGLENFMMRMKGKQDRSCEFRQCLVYSELENSFQSVVRGRIADKPRGNGGEEGEYPYWSQYSRVFIPEGQNMTLAEMIDKDEFERWQQARILESATGKFAKWFSDILKAKGKISEREFMLFQDKLQRQPETKFEP